MPQIDQPVESFSAAATGDATVRLSELAGKSVVLYFYPKDDTPGCTREGQDFRDLYPKFQAAGAEIFGVSRDTLAKHEKFIAKYEFPFALLSDEDEALCQQFDVIKEKNMYGRKYMGIERSTFLIDSAGVLRAEWRKVKVKEHAQAVLDAVLAL